MRAASSALHWQSHHALLPFPAAHDASPQAWVAPVLCSILGRAAVMSSVADLLVSSDTYRAAYDAANNLRISFVAAAVFGIWDIIVTHDQERRLLWPRRTSAAKIAFLVSRYYFLFGWLPLCASAVFGIFAPATCNKVYWIHPVSCILAILPGQLLLAFRVCALYSWDRCLLAALITLIVAVQAVPLGMMVAAKPIAPLAGIPGCPALIPLAPRLGAFFWTPAAVFEVVILALVLTRFFAHRRLTSVSGPDLLGRLAVDAVLYFIPITSLTLANAILSAQGAYTTAQQLCMYPAVAAVVVLSSRLVLSLHRDMLGDGADDSHESLQTRILRLLKGKEETPSTVPASSDLFVLRHEGSMVSGRVVSDEKNDLEELRRGSLPYSIN